MTDNNSSKYNCDVAADRSVRWATLLAATVIIAGLTIIVARNDVDSAGLHSALDYQRGQAKQVIEINGFYAVDGLTQHIDGSWRAVAQRSGSRWHVEVSPYGALSTHVVIPISLKPPVPTSQLGIVLQ